jgi:hypothetical protein
MHDDDLGRLRVRKPDHLIFYHPALVLLELTNPYYHRTENVNKILIGQYRTRHQKTATMPTHCGQVCMYEWSVA